MKGIWIVNSRTVFESFRRCKVCWLSAVIVYLIVSSCCVTCSLPQRTLASALVLQVLDLLCGVPVSGMQKPFSTTGKFKISTTQYQQLTCPHQMLMMIAAQLVPSN